MTYDDVNATWPETLPPITRSEASRACRRLAVHFDGREATRGAIYRYTRTPRRCWISTKPLPRGVDRGWWRLVHDVSHLVFRRQNRHTVRGGHGGWHAELERKMVEHVLANGWLDGRLKTVKAPPLTVEEKRAARRAHAEQMLATWERRAKRATNKVRLWRARLRRAERLGEKII